MFAMKTFECVPTHNFYSLLGLICLRMSVTGIFNSTTIRAAVLHAPPEMERLEGKDGRIEWSGLNVDFFRAVAASANLNITFVEVNPIPSNNSAWTDMLSMLYNNKADIGLWFHAMRIKRSKAYEDKQKNIANR